MVLFDPFSYAIQDDPFPAYRRLRDEAPGSEAVTPEGLRSSSTARS